MCTVFLFQGSLNWLQGSVEVERVPSTVFDHSRGKFVGVDILLSGDKYCVVSIYIYIAAVSSYVMCKIHVKMSYIFHRVHVSVYCIVYGR